VVVSARAKGLAPPISVRSGFQQARTWRHHVPNAPAVEQIATSAAYCCRLARRFAARHRRKANERSRRLLAAVEAKTAGYGGIAAASRATGIARSTIDRGLKDLADPRSLSGKVRRPGSGCPPLTLKDLTLMENLRLLVEPATMGESDASAAVGLEEP
jgi:hypothetical protein